MSDINKDHFSTRNYVIDEIVWPLIINDLCDQ